MIRVLSLGFLAFFLIWPPPASAQGLPSLATPDTSGVTITTNNPFPQPGQVITVTVNDFTLSSRQGTILWRINNVEQPNLTNSREIRVAIGSAGERQIISMSYVTPQGTTYRDSLTITPQYLDVVVEPLTYAPVTYKGRPLPIERSQVIVTALLFNGSSLTSVGDYFYRWELNGKVLNQGPVKGLYKTLITLPMGRSSNLLVEISNNQGIPVTRRRITIQSHQVDVRFYEVNPLFGLSHMAAQNPILQGGAMSVYAIPYNMDSQQPLESQVTTWKVDGRRVDPGSNPFLLTINRQNRRASRVEFSIRNRIELLQGGEGSFQVTY